MDETTEIQVRLRLSRTGARLTAIRATVLDAIIERGGPTSAADLAAALPEVPLSSLYRSLAALCDAGVIASIPGAEGILLYEPAEWFSGHHHHLVCRVCGTVLDMEVAGDVEAALDHLTAAAADRHAFRVDGHRLTLEGRCAGCAHA